MALLREIGAAGFEPATSGTQRREPTVNDREQ
jgi:hypothetical protein